MIGKSVAATVTAAVALIAGGCARVPNDTTGGTRSKLLVVTMALRGPILVNRPSTGGNYYYVVINRTNNASDPGPVPVIGLPWGNGFAAPAQPGYQGFVAFVRFDGTVSGIGGYDVDYVPKNPADPTGNTLSDVTTFGPLTFPSLGPPDAVTPVNPGQGSTLSFQLDLARIDQNLPTSLQNARYIQINMIATDRVPQGVSDVPKLWDSLGDGTQSGFRNFFVTLDATQNQTARNEDRPSGDGSHEPSDDVFDRGGFAPVNDPSLDIIDWNIQIRDK
jgi:hypothetical protein